MSELVAWLEGLGLGQYARLFAEHDLDLQVLPELKDLDLRNLGVSLGHRKKLLKAAADLGALQKARSAQTDAAATMVSDVRPSPRLEAERRHLTVMFCDLVDSTAMSARLDPEDMRDIIGAYQHCCAEVIVRSGGFVAKYMGDGVLAYFGYPQAHEDDAERAVRAALSLIEAVPKLYADHDPVLQVRIGIATGIVVVGDLIGSGEAQERGVVGETPNIAARLQALAEPGQVVISQNTRRLTGGLFEYRDLGRIALRGLPESAHALRVLGPSAVESRFEAQHESGFTPLVGREEELELLLRRWRHAKEGEGRVVFLTGEAGIGKSRILRALREGLEGDPYIPLSYFCSPYHQDSPLYPLIDQLSRASGFRNEDTVNHKLSKLEALLRRSANGPEEIGLIAELLSLPIAEHQSSEPNPQRRKEKTLKALLAQMANLAAQQPVLMTFEDVHWSDPTSREIMDLTIKRVQTLPVLLLVTFRPEFTPPWPEYPHVTTVTLARLGRQESSTLIEQVAGGKALPEEVMSQILARTDGVPLFLEELTKTVLESGLLRDRDGEYMLDGPLPALAIPTTLHDSLMARLDRLAPVKEIAQVGAAIGREFRYALLRSVARSEETTLSAALAQLEEAGLLFRRGMPPDASYTFKHALVQGAAYESLLKSRRQILHKLIAEALRDQFPGQAEGEPEVVAHHFTQAGMLDLAVEWWGKAGERALRRSAFQEAISHFKTALALVERLAQGPAQRQLRLRLQVAYGNALFAARGYGAPETTLAFVRARELAAEIEDSAERSSVLYGLWVGSFTRCELAPMCEMAEAFLRDAERPGSPDGSVAHRIFGATRWFQGDFIGARLHLEQAIAAYDQERDRSLAFRFGQDAGVGPMCWLTLVLWPIGEVTRACSLAEEAITRAREIGHVPTLVYAHFFKCVLEVLRGDAGLAASHAEAQVRLSREHGLQLYLAGGTFMQGWTRWHSGSHEIGLAEMRRSAALLHQLGFGTFMPIFALLPAEAEAALGNIEAALSHLDRAIVELERMGQRWFDAELQRHRGELLLRREPANSSQAEEAFLRAIEVARKQQTRMFELRAANALAKLWREQGKRMDAYHLLAPIYDGFSEGFETADLMQAKALLTQLS